MKLWTPSWCAIFSLPYLKVCIIASAEFRVCTLGHTYGPKSQRKLYPRISYAENKTINGYSIIHDLAQLRPYGENWVRLCFFLRCKLRVNMISYHVFRKCDKFATFSTSFSSPPLPKHGSSQLRRKTRHKTVSVWAHARVATRAANSRSLLVQCWL